MPVALHPRQLTTILLALGVMVAAFFTYAVEPITHDTAWFMYAARGMLHGGTLYQDYVDVNAPPAYWSLILAAALSSIISNEAALTLNILLYIAITFILCAAVIRHMALPERQQNFLLIAMLADMAFMPHFAFGQREHIFAVLFMPYILAAGLRSDNRVLPHTLAIACGIAAALGASIKPQFLIVPAFVEAAVLLRRGWKIRLTPDVLALGISTLAIFALCYLLYPIYWEKILPQAMALYGPYNNFQFLTDALLLQVPLFAVGFVVGEYRGRGALTGARWMLVAATLGAFALFILQRKGWPHHSLPILMFMGTLFAFNLAELKTEIARRVISAGALICAFVVAFMGSGVSPDMIRDVEARVRDTNGSFYIISTGNYPAFPLALNPAYTWTSRFPQLILLPGLIQAEMLGKPSPYAANFRAAINDDLQKGKPATIFLYSGVDAGGIDGNMMLDWLMRDLDFSLDWRSYYRWTGTAGPFAVFTRKK